MDTRKGSKTGTLRSLKSICSNNETKTDLLTSKARGSVYNSTIGIASQFPQGAQASQVSNKIQEEALPPPPAKTATLNAKYSTLGRRPLPLTPDEMKSKETPIPRVPDEMPLNAASLGQYRSLQRNTSIVNQRNNPSYFNSLQRPHQHPGCGMNNSSSSFSQLETLQDADQRQLYAVTEL